MPAQRPMLVVIAPEFSFETLGSRVLAWATAALCGVTLALGDPDGALFPIGWSGVALTTALAGVVGAAAIAGVGLGTRWLWLIVGVFWIAQAMVGLQDLTIGAIGFTSFVPLVEAVVVTLAITLVLWREPLGALRLLLVVASSLMLLLFGVIHLTSAALIAGLVPSWFPLRPAVPFATGSLQVAAAAGMLWPRTRTIAALGTAMIFASWLPLIHAARLARFPTDVGEWRFALTALALAGALLVAGASRRRSASNHAVAGDGQWI